MSDSLTLTKTCNRCGQTKTLDQFYRSKVGVKGRVPSCKPCASKRVKELRVPSKDREKRLKKTFGITLDDYDNMLREQQGRCAICLIDQKDLGRSLAVDHCHSTGQVRGLLCRSCNLGIGNLRDNPESILRAFVYLGYVDTSGARA